MAGTDAHTQIVDHNPPCQDQVSKRKPEADDPRRSTKIPRLDNDQLPNHQSPNRDRSSENGENEKVNLDKGKGKLIAQEEDPKPDENPKPISPPKVSMDKGKGKMIMQEEEEEESGDDDEVGVRGWSDSDYSDDPLMEVDLNNILPSRTRKVAPPVPGAYLVPDQDEEEEDDEDVDVDDSDSDDEGEEEDDDE